MAKVVSTIIHRQGRGRCALSVYALPDPGRIQDATRRSPGRAQEGADRVYASAGSLVRADMESKERALIALRAFHPILDPLVGGDAGRRVHALGREAHDVDHFRLVLLLVEAVGPVCGLLDTLVAVAEREFDRAARRFVRDAFECGRDLVGGWLAAAFFLLRFFPRHFQAEDRQRHLIGGIGWGRAVTLEIDLVEPVVERALGRQRSVRPTDRKSTRLNSSHMSISYAV